MTDGDFSSRLRDRLAGRRLVVVSNREPYVHNESSGEIRCMRPASGVTAALDPVLRACGGLWIAHGSGNADRQASPDGRLEVPPDSPRYTLRRVWLTKEEEEGYYYGFANQALWPLCHVAYQRPTFRREDWERYFAVNRKFAGIVAEEVGNAPAVVFVQDYHFALLPWLLRPQLPNARLVQFWHIPWPNPEAFRICPWKTEILEGLLGNDLLAFHIQYHCNNFLDTVDRELEARVDRERFGVSFRGRMTFVRPAPISVDFDEISDSAASPDCLREMERIRRRHRLEGQRIALGVDRLDYTKGIPERLRAVDRFLALHPQHRERFVFVQIGAPSRTHIQEYHHLGEEVEQLVDEINWRHKTERWSPILYLHEHVPQEGVRAWYRLADLCLVTSLHDGMNLVAKEFVASRVDRRGVLVLSTFTGSARELAEAVQVNPYAVDALADAISGAFDMPADEQERRMTKLRERVAGADVYRWATKILGEVLRLVPE